MRYFLRDSLDSNGFIKTKAECNYSEIMYFMCVCMCFVVVVVIVDVYASINYVTCTNKVSHFLSLPCEKGTGEY